MCWLGMGAVIVAAPYIATHYSMHPVTINWVANILAYVADLMVENVLVA
jgi:hypothetical protein